MKKVFIILLVFCVLLFGCQKSNSTSNIISPTLPKIVIDAGHGGIDGGAIATDNTLEKDLNLQISLILVDLFRLMGYNIVTTRTDDRSIHDDGIKTIRNQKISDIHNRLKLIDDTDAEALISIHQNKFSESKYRGTQVFYGRLNSYSQLLAKSVQQSVKTMLQPENSREHKKGDKNIYLLYHCKKPIILVECGFLSNSDELGLLKTNEYQKQLCFAIFSGFAKCDTENENG